MDGFVVPIFCTKEEHFLKRQQEQQELSQQPQQPQQPQQSFQQQPHPHPQQPFQPQPHPHPHPQHIDKRYSDKHCREGILYRHVFNRSHCFIMSNCC